MYKNEIVVQSVGCTEKETVAFCKAVKFCEKLILMVWQV